MSRKSIWWACCLLAGGLSAGVAMAEPGGQGQGKGKGKHAPEERFARIDANSDGALTLEEFSTAHARRMEKMKAREDDLPEGARTPPPPAEIFRHMDADSDGAVTLAEFTAHARNREAGKGGKPDKKKQSTKD